MREVEVWLVERKGDVRNADGRVVRTIDQDRWIAQCAVCFYYRNYFKSEAKAKSALNRHKVLCNKRARRGDFK